MAVGGEASFAIAHTIPRPIGPEGRFADALQVCCGQPVLELLRGEQRIAVVPVAPSDRRAAGGQAVFAHRAPDGEIRSPLPPSVSGSSRDLGRSSKTAITASRQKTCIVGTNGSP